MSDDAPAPPSRPTHTRYVAGEIIGEKYELLQQLDEGGMGSLWIAKNQALDAQVVLKLIRADVAAAGADERFLTEARAAARLKHPGIVRVFDFGRTRHNEPFIVMELLHGENLGDMLDREGRFSAVQALQVLLPIVDGLVAAHARGVVHRDLKPDNVFISDTDGRLQPKLLDFGIARLGGAPLGDHRITQAGTVVGSPDYMAPEQARGLDDIDQRADIWALCVMVYECVTGRVPFEDKNYNSLLRHIIEDPIPSILELGAGDDELWEILKKGFEKDREKRYQSMRELGEALAHWLVTRGITEDICGQSLRAAWLDTVGGGRPSLVSFTGLRALTPSTMPPPMANRAPTPSASTAPPSIASTAPPPMAPPSVEAEVPPPELRSSSLRRHLILVGVLALLVGAGFTVMSLWARAEKERAPAAGPEQGSRGAPATAPTTATPLAATTASESPMPAAPDPAEKKRRPSAKTPNPQVPPRASGAKPSPPPPTPSKPTGGYGEDLGF